jgi:hypothetical protein
MTLFRTSSIVLPDSNWNFVGPKSNFSAFFQIVVFGKTVNFWMPGPFGSAMG